MSKNSVYKDNEKSCMHVSFVEVPIPNCIHSLNMLFTHPVFAAEQNSESFSVLALEKQLLSSEMFSALQGSSAFKK